MQRTIIGNIAIGAALILGAFALPAEPRQTPEIQRLVKDLAKNGIPRLTPKPLHCFPAKKWDTRAADRPCVFRLYEDGSVIVKQRDGGAL